MNNRDDIRRFLVSRRARITPEQAGLPTTVGNRRVPGLRREEVAALAGMSVEYYIRLERGNLAGVSASVLEALARALLLDEAERAHLFDLARAVGSRNNTPRPARQEVRPSVQLALDAIVNAPAFVRNGRRDFLAANRLGRALYSELYANPARPANNARFIFLDEERSRRFYPDWDLAANNVVAVLRAAAGRDPNDPALSHLVGELSTHSQQFRTRWAAHNVRHHTTGTKHFNHPIVGELHLMFEASDLSADPGLSLVIYTAQPGSPSEDALRLLATWAATQDQEHPRLLESRQSSQE